MQRHRTLALWPSSGLEIPPFEFRAIRSRTARAAAIQSRHREIAANLVRVAPADAADQPSRASTTEAGPNEIAALLVAGVRAQLGDAVRSVIGHGSWVHGDFAVGRSDLDVLVVLRADRTPTPVEQMAPVLDGIVGQHPQWRDRLEVGFVSREAVADVLAGRGERMVARVSPGEPLHLVTADRYRLLDWEAARRGRRLHGEAPTAVLPRMPLEVIRAVAREQLHEWPSWVAGVGATGPVAFDFQAYAVLTVSRALALTTTGEQLSKRQAGAWARARFPEWVALIDWAVDRWYHPSGAETPPPGAGVEQFVASAVTDARPSSTT